MRKPPLATIINFCTNEARFLTACIEQSRIFSRQILIPVCSSFFDGTPENRALLEEIFASFPDCQFIEYPLLAHRVPRKQSAAHFWPSASRALAYTFLDEEIESVLFLDTDEVPEGQKLLEWFKSSDYVQHSALKFSNYWYFREPQYRAMSWEDSIVLAHRSALTQELLLHDNERDAIYDLMPFPKKRKAAGWDGQPMFHHFSWVRTKEEMLKKVMSWGHRSDRDWASLVEEEFKAPFRGKDFVHGYSYQTASPPFPIAFDPPRFLPKGTSSVIRVSEEEWLDRLKISESVFAKGFFHLKRLTKALRKMVVI